MPINHACISYYTRGSVLSVGPNKVPHMVKEVYVKIGDNNLPKTPYYFLLQEDGLHGTMMDDDDERINGDLSYLYESGTFIRR